ncbi:transcriptional regulator, IclR family [Microbacterium sp. cf046]|uniref:IclR family transcriptional regulator n=1 Tax=Microbacterium sp. cf046 TaxID=1761803 RepID=UPI0008E86D36|nr:IclR family transcriptional regulator [Microbacterium sp. cf046]SFS12644.1 transcriptional regulator, IclR family [Microbacterium sp. cf046]
MAVPDKTLVVLGAFSIERPSMTLSELARATGLAPSTVHRVISSLVIWGALEKDPHNRYVIGQRLWQLGTLAPRAFEQRALVLPFLERLFLDTRLPVALSAFHPDGSVVVEQHLGWRDGDNSAGLGERLPLHASSPGLILLAYGPAGVRRAIARHPLRRYTSRTVVDPAALGAVVDRVRHAGIAVSEGALIATTSSTSAPVFGHRGELYGAVTIVWTTGSADPRQFADRLRSTANRISAVMRESTEEPVPHPVRRGVFDPPRGQARPVGGIPPARSPVKDEIL